MCQQTLHQPTVGIWTHGVVGAERQDHQLHEQKKSDSEEDAADNEVITQKGQTFACQAICGGCGEGDQVVDGESEDVLAGRHVPRCWTDQGTGDPDRHVTAESDVRGGHIEQASDGAPDKDWDGEIEMQDSQGYGTGWPWNRRPQGKRCDAISW